MISVCMLSKNCASTLSDTLRSTRAFSEVLLLDNGSTDDTLSIARTFSHVRIEMSPFLGFGALRNRAAALAQSDWVLALDSDEVLSPTLIEEISTLKLDPSCAYSIPRHNYYRGKRIRGCGWDPERVVRLYHRNATRFSEDAVHESLLINSVKVLSLKHPILHTPYRSTTDFLAKMQHYSTLFAQQYQHQRSSSFKKALLHGFFAFFRSYLLQRGIFCGSRGFILSLYNGNTTFYKYLKLAELQSDFL